MLCWRYLEIFFVLKVHDYVCMRLICRMMIDEVIVTSTYGAILQKIAELPLSSAEIRFNKRVVSIEGPEDGRDTNHRVLLRTDDGLMQSFDEVVLTTPLGWLKRNKTAFSPDLPSRLSQAIDNVSVGYLEKVGPTICRRNNLQNMRCLIEHPPNPGVHHIHESILARSLRLHVQGHFSGIHQLPLPAL